MCVAQSHPQCPLNCRMGGMKTAGLLELFVLPCLKDPAGKKVISYCCIAVIFHDRLIIRCGDKLPRNVWILVEGPW